MSDIKINQDDIIDILTDSDIEVATIFGKCTIVTCKLPNGFIITESSACVHPENYDKDLGTSICLERIENKLWELEGYALQKKVYEEERNGNRN